MKVLLFNGSPHEKGCTYTALCEVASELQKEGIDFEIMWVGKDPLKTCTGCGACRKNPEMHCVFDDIVNVAIEKAKTADAYIIGSPVHYSGAAGTFVSFLGRFFYGKESMHRFKLGASVASCRRAGSTATLEQLNQFLTYGSMTIVGSQYWNMVHGNTSDEVKQDLEGMQIMRTLGKNMAWRLKCVEAAKNAGVEPPTLETRVGTNFIR